MPAQTRSQSKNQSLQLAIGRPTKPKLWSGHPVAKYDCSPYHSLAPRVKARKALLAWRMSLIPRKKKKALTGPTEKKRSTDNFAFDFNSIPKKYLTKYLRDLFTSLANPLVSHGEGTYISNEKVDSLLEKCGFHFGDGAISVFHAVLSPVRPLIRSNRHPTIHRIDDCIKALMYCRDREFFKWNGEYGAKSHTYTSYK